MEYGHFFYGHLLLECFLFKASCILHVNLKVMSGLVGMWWGGVVANQILVKAYRVTIKE